MNKYIFKSLKDPDNEFSISDIAFEIETANRSELLEQFVRFLSACGYNTEDLEEEFGI